MKLLYVDGALVDLYPTTVIAQTLQVYDPGRVGSIVTNYTSSILVPKTRSNEIIFGFLSNSKTKSNVPYSSLSCRYEENGLPIIRNARVVITEVDKDYSLTIYSGPWGFFERISQLTLWDLNFLDINGPWDDTSRDGYRSAVTGIVQALVDDGRLVQDSVSTAPTIENQGGLFKPPQVYYHTAVEKIFSSFNYVNSGDIFDNEIYKALIMPLSVIYNDPAFLESKMFFAAANGAQIIVNPVAEVEVEFTENVKQGSDNFYDSVSKYVIANPDTAGKYFRLQFKSDLTIVVTGGTVDLKIEATGYTPTSELNVGSGTYPLQFLSSLGHADTDEVKVTVVNNTGTPTVEIISGTFYTVSFTGTDGFEFAPSIVPEYVYFNKLFEKITLLDFLKEFCVRFNVQITQINNEIVCNTLNYILDIKTGPDWTTKRDKGLNKIKWLFANYGRTNFLKSPQDDSTPDLTDNYGDGLFEIPNENLKESTTIYTSMFAVTEMINTFGVFMAKLNLEPNLTEFARMPGKRLLFVRTNYDFEPPVLYDTVDRSDYLVAYHFDPHEEREMSWQFFIDNFHQKYLDRCLRKVRLIEREYNLSDLDIYSFNQQIPIWDDGERFLVTKIINRVTKHSCKVDLLKIEANPENFFIAGAANEISGDIEDYIEEIGDTVPAELIIQMQLVESVTGNPTWETEFDNGDIDTLSCLGNGSSDSGLLVPHSGEIDVVATVDKTDNDGFGTPGFPTATGWVEWLRDGVQEHTDTFNTSTPAAAQGLTYTFPDVVAFEILKVVVHEDGTSP